MGDFNECLEQRILEIGVPFVDAAQAYKPRLEERANNALFDFCMKDEHTRTQLLKVLQVLPRHETAEEVKELLQREIFSKGLSIPGLTAGGIISKVMPGMDKIVKGIVKRMANALIAGSTIEEVYQNLGGLDADPFSLDIVGERICGRVEADKHIKDYKRVLGFLGKVYKDQPLDRFGHPRIDISLKLSALDPKFDPVDPEGTSGRVRERLREIVREVIKVNGAFNIDAEWRQYRELTYKIFIDLLEEKEFRDFPHAGTVVQAYLIDSEKPLMYLINWAKKHQSIKIRLVKGAYWDNELKLADLNEWHVPVFTKKWRTDAHYEKLAEILLRNTKYVNAAIATHDPRQINQGIALRDILGIDYSKMIVQLLHGMANTQRAALIQYGIPYQMYVPDGEGETIETLAYLGRRMLETTANVSCTRRLSKADNPRELLINPLKIGEANNESLKQPTKIPREEGKFTNFEQYDFSLEQNRTNMQNAIDRRQSEIDKRKPTNLEYKLQIGNESIDTGKYIESKNPSDISQVIGRVSAANKETIDYAFETAGKAFKEWSVVPPKERAQYLFKTAEIMIQRRFDLAALVVYELGKTWRETMADVTEAIDFLNFYAYKMIELSELEITQKRLGESNRLVWRSRGIVPTISPFNFLAIRCGLDSGAIVAGDTVLMKPASLTPLTAGAMAKMSKDAGLPPGVLNYIPFNASELIDHTTTLGDYLVQHRDASLVAFTGSKNMGFRIYERIAHVQEGQRYMKMAILEMGGKNVIIFTKTADPDIAFPATITSKFGYQGQKCSACDIVAIPKSIYNPTVDRLCEAAAALQLGPAHLPSTDVGPMINKAAYDKVLRYIEIGKKEGNILLEGEHYNNHGYYIGPTIIEAKETDTIAREEIFGPVLAVIKVEDYNEALRIMNTRDYALTGAIMSMNQDQIDHFFAHAEPGNIYSNKPCTGSIVERQPFGGSAHSGLGHPKAGYKRYIEYLMRPISISENIAYGPIPGIDAFCDKIG